MGVVGEMTCSSTVVGRVQIYLEEADWLLGKSKRGFDTKNLVWMVVTLHNNGLEHEHVGNGGIS